MQFDWTWGMSQVHKTDIAGFSRSAGGLAVVCFSSACCACGMSSYCSICCFVVKLCRDSHFEIKQCHLVMPEMIPEVTEARQSVKA